MPLNLPGPGPLVQTHHPAASAGALVSITPDTGINATSSVTGTVVRRVPITPAAITAASSMTATVTKLARITPAAVNATSAVSASVKNVDPIAPGALTATSTVAAAVVKLAAVKATVSATSPVNATVTKPGLASIVPASISSTSTVTGTGVITIAHGSWVAPTVGTQIGKSIDRARTR